MKPAGKKETKAHRKAIPSPAEPPPPSPIAPPEPLRGVVGVGASAGGLEAFTDLLKQVPADSGMAFIFVQHLDPKHSSALTDLLSRSTPMPVVQVTDGLPAAPNRVYVIPPNANMILTKQGLQLEPRPTGQHMPIDRFFRSLAETQGGQAIGVILSGSASDGTLGCKAIKEAGGICFAQDPNSAKYDGMPRSAVATGCVDFVLTPGEIARELIRLQDHPYISHPAPADDEAPTQENSAFSEIFNMLRSATGVDFSLYKPGTIRRRILRRMALHKMHSVEQYKSHLKQHRSEVSLLFQDQLINVTAFFREPVTFDFIKSRILPRIFE